MHERLPRRRIVRRRRHFDAAFSGTGLRLHGRSLTLLALPKAPGDASPDEVAFLSPKRLGDAVLRNRLRRRLREAYRRHLAPRLPRPSPLRLLWMAKHACGTLPLPDLAAQMEALHAQAVAKLVPPPPGHA
ncbi:MAG TPA: ribonuclease P protein component [Candidatus Methylacidiphilales bacterium]